MTSMTSMTPEQRSERAKKAASARWNEQRFDWENAPMEEAFKHLAELRSEAERGGLVLQRRSSDNRIQLVECYNPTCMKGPADAEGNPTRTIIDIGSGRFAGSRTRHNPETGAVETAYACSAACYLYMSGNFTHQSPAPRSVQPMLAEPEVVLNEAAKNITG